MSMNRLFLAGSLCRLAGGGTGRLAQAFAQPVFVTNWPPGMMAPGAGNPLAPTTAAGRGFLGSVKAGLMAGMKWIGGPLAAIFAGYQIGNQLIEPMVAPARDFETSEFEAAMARSAGDPKALARIVDALEAGLHPDDDPWTFTA